MRYGLFLGDQATDLNGLIDAVRDTAKAGFASVWLPQIFNMDALSALAIAGHAVPGIELGTAVVPTYPRHPMAMASSALTTQAATGNRLVLGIGLSHQIVVESMWGYSFDKPARHMREYLDALMPLLRGENANVHGETLTCVGQVTVKDASAPPVLLAALAPVMLKLAGTVADGTATWMVGPATLADHIVPSISNAAASAGRAAPRIGVGLPVCLTNDVDAARERVARELVIYGQLPSYRAMLDREGADGPADIAIMGDEAAVRAGVARVADAGGTDFIASCFGSGEEITRTKSLLAAIASA
jgi:F420-dependent oxidoreductase-like protein